jgi:hypothetical protein
MEHKTLSYVISLISLETFAEQANLWLCQIENENFGNKLE